MYHINQYFYIISSAIGKVIFERKPLGELFVKLKHHMKDPDNDQLTLWEKSLNNNV